MTNYGFEVLLARYQQPGYYNDPDFIIADWPWLTLDEKKSQFALWSSFSAPLIISSYIPDLTDAEVDYLTNADVIAIDQDALALQATLVSQDGYFDVLTKSLANGDRLLTVLNHGDEANSTTVSTERMGLIAGSSYIAKDLWTGESQHIHGSIDVSLNTHATGMYRISGCSSATPTGMIFNTASMKCLTASNSKVIFAKCQGTDEQVWQVSAEGSISSLASDNLCLTAADGKVTLQACSNGDDSMKWTYHVTGNLVNDATHSCLQQGSTLLGHCHNERDKQVLGLPSGVRVVRGNVV